MRPSLLCAARAAGISMLVLSGCGDGGAGGEATPANLVEVGDQPITREILARPLWNGTGLMVRRGAHYHFQASGTWTDFFIPALASGYSRDYLRWAEQWRRVPSQNWFTLICSVNRGTELVPISTGGDFQFEADGQLTCFANDMSLMYWNNFGEVRMTVRRMHSN